MSCLVRNTGGGSNSNGLGLDLIWTNPHKINGTSYDTNTNIAGTKYGFSAGVMDLNKYSRFFVEAQPYDDSPRRNTPVLIEIFTSKYDGNVICQNQYIGTMPNSAEGRGDGWTFERVYYFREDTNTAMATPPQGTLFFMREGTSYGSSPYRENGFPLRVYGVPK